LLTETTQKKGRIQCRALSEYNKAVTSKVPVQTQTQTHIKTLKIALEHKSNRKVNLQ